MKVSPPIGQMDEQDRQSGNDLGILLKFFCSVDGPINLASLKLQSVVHRDLLATFLAERISFGFGLKSGCVILSPKVDSL